MQVDGSTSLSPCRKLPTAERASSRSRISRAWLFLALGALLALAIIAGCASPPHPRHHPMPPIARRTDPEGAPRPIGATASLDLSAMSDLETLIPTLARSRVVLVGETHDRLDHHLVQLEIIRGLHAIHPELAIGMEAFQQPFQRHLDDYVAGELGERELLRRTEYHRRWGYDFRLYQPILDYAREHRLPVVALNLPVEITRKVGERGIEGLIEEERAAIPAEIDRSDSAYQKRLEEIFEQHPQREGRGFDRFLEVQLSWDEGMAECAARFLESHPQHKMVILAGSGHLAYGSGIPRRVVRRIQVDTATLLSGWEGEIEPGLADYLLFPQERHLPAAGRIGAMLGEDRGSLEIVSCASGSGCEKAGLEAGDRILSVERQPVASIADLKGVLWDRSPGDRIQVEIRRRRWLSGARRLTLEVALQ